MSRNALLEAPIGNDRTPAGGYHSPMGDQFRQAPAPHQWHQPPYPPAPAPAAGRRWMPVAVISAAIIIAAALVAGAIIMSRGDATQATAGGSDGSGLAVTANSSTCQAWKTTRVVIQTIPNLPPGWDWETPNIDTLINNQSTALNAALDRFETEIAAEPSDVASAANDYIASRRKEMKLLAEHTYAAGDRADVDQALVRLEALCGFKG